MFCVYVFPMAYGKDVRRLVYELVEGGGSKAEAARRFGLSRRTVYNWLNKGADYATRGTPGPKHSHKIDMQRLKEAVSRQPDATLHELADIFSVHYSTVSYALKRTGYSRKKRVGDTVSHWVIANSGSVT